MSRASLVELEAVAAVARLGGFRAAARELGMSSSSVSHAVAALEARLGVRLFNRTTRSVALSAAGEQFLAAVAPALAAIDAAVEGVDQHRAEPSGTLRLNAALGAARMIFQPLILEYLRRYPQMSVDLVTDNALVDIVGRGFDAGVRLAEMVPPDMISVPIRRELRQVVVAAPACFEDRPRPQTPADLMQHRCVRMRLPSGSIYRWEFERHGEVVEIDAPGTLILDESSLILDAARAGAGLAFLSDWAVAADLASGRLVQVLDDWTPAFPGLHLYYPGRRHVPAKLRAFVDLIRESADR